MCYRIIKHSDKVFLVLHLNPRHTLDDILITFIGPEYKVKPIRETYEINKKNSPGYDNEGFLRHILNLIELKYFLEQAEGMQTEKECSICLEYRDDLQKAPLIYCEREACEGAFHESCLQKFIADKREKMLVCEVVIGPCPMLHCGSIFRFNTNIFN